MRALVTAAAIGAAALLTLGVGCGAHSSANRALQTRYDRCLAAAGFEACADLAPRSLTVTR